MNQIINYGKLKPTNHHSPITIHQSPFTNHCGFTLIELLIGIAIIGILATSLFTVLNPLEQIKKTRDSQRKHDFDQLRKALEIYFIDNGSIYPPAVDDKINGIDWGQPFPSYAAKLPKDPLDSQPYVYQAASDQSWYRLFAKLEKCPDPQMIPGATCTVYNYSVASPNIVAALLPTPPPTNTPIPPTPTPTPRPFKYVFVTSGTYNGDLKTQGLGADGLEGGDNICESLADNSTIPSVRGLTWKAWLSTTVNAVDRVYPPGTEDTVYKLVDNDTTVALNKADLISGDIENPINRNENNVPVGVGGVVVWTGTKTDGTPSTNNCDGWFTGSWGSIGFPWKKDAWWTYSGGINLCSETRRFYCFEQ